MNNNCEELEKVNNNNNIKHIVINKPKEKDLFRGQIISYLASFFKNTVCSTTFFLGLARPFLAVSTNLAKP